MAFVNTSIRETDTEEAARLARSPKTSINHSLSLLPVTMREWPEGQLVMLPRRTAEDTRTIVVVPCEFRPALRPSRRLRDGSWNCIVVQSNHEMYPVGGPRIVVSEAELRRSRLVTTSLLYEAIFGVRVQCVGCNAWSDQEHETGCTHPDYFA